MLTMPIIMNQEKAVISFFFFFLFFLSTPQFLDKKFNELLSILANALMSVAVILNAARNSASFVALLVVCMGYGLLKFFFLFLNFFHFIFQCL